MFTFPVGNLVSAASSPADNLNSNLISWWTLDEATGSFLDSRGSNDTTTRTCGSATGKIGNAASVGNTTADYAEITSNSTLQTGDIDFTVCCWVYLNSASNYNIFVAKDDGSNRDLLLLCDAPGDGGTFRFSVYTPTDIRVSSTSLGTPSTGTWYFLCAWHDAAADMAYLQVNNGTIDSQATGGSLYPAGYAAWTFGQLGGGAYSLTLDGRVDEVGFWKRVLTTGERTALYNAGSGVTYSSFGVTEYAPSSFSQSSDYTGVPATTTTMADRDYTTGTGTYGGGSEWIKADLGSAQSVGRVRVAGGPLAGWGGAAGYLNGFDIQYSTNDSTWTTFATIAGASDYHPYAVDMTSTPVTARYWRIYATGYMATTEFRFYPS